MYVASSRKRAFFLLLATCYLLLALRPSAQTLPRPLGRISDFANVIDPATEADLDHRIDLLEQQTASEVAVATVESLDGMSVEEYANRLFKEWGIGRAKQDNGVLVLVAPNEREMRIEVGYGLEGVLPDGLAGEMIREAFTPRFRDGDYSGGIRDGVGRVIAVVERHQVLTAEELARFNSGGDEEIPTWAVLPFFGVFVTIGFGMLGIGLRSKTVFPMLFGSFFGGMPLLMSIAVVGSLTLATLVPWAIAMFVVGYRLGGRESWRNAFRDSGKGGRGGGSSGGWTMGSSGRSGSSSGSSSSSSFGGGSSGGGGASGRW